MQSKHIYLAIEGIDGTGKTHIVRYVAERFNFSAVKEPSQNTIGKLITDGKWNSITDFYLFMADRSEALSSLNSSECIVSDRSLYSSYAYQGVELQHTFGTTEKYFDFFWKAARTLPLLPTHVIVVVMDVEKAMERVVGRGVVSRFEKLDYLKRVQDMYYTLQGRIPNLWFVHNDGTIEELYSSIDDLVLAMMENTGSACILPLGSSPQQE
jgi:thymidylate kinase